MKKLLLFIASMLMTVSLMAADLKTSEPMKLAETTIKGVALSAPVEEAPSLSQFEVPVVEAIKLSEKNIPDGIENAQRTGIRKAPAATVKISGLVDASTIADNAVIELVGNANLFMDVNKTFKCITGNYALTLSGGNILTLSNAGEYAIDALSVTISCPLVVLASEVAVSAKYGVTINSSVNATSTNTCIGTVNGIITINADVTATTGNSAAILNRGLNEGGDIIINKGVIKATGGNSGIWAYGIAAMGHITAKEGTVIHASGGTGIYAETGNIHLAGEVTANANGDDGSGVYAQAGEVSLSTISISSSGVGISAYNGLTLNGVTITNTADTGLGTVNGTLTINADVTATTAKSAAILSRGRDQGGDIIINSGTITATGGNTGIWAYGIAAGGNITAKEGTVIHASGGTGIYAETGNIHLAGEVTANANGDDGSGVYAQAGEVSLSTISISSSGVGISAYNGLTLNGVTITNTADTGLGTVNGTLTINADVTATTAKSAAILSRGRDQGGDIIINSGTITATGGNTGIWAYGIAARGSITSQAETVINVTAGTGIYSEEGNIHLSGETTSIAKGEVGFGLYAEAGEISVSTLDVSNAHVGISAHNGITINGSVNATSTNTCIGTVNGTITVNADVTATTSSSAAILNRGLDQGGDIIINKGTIRATGGNSGIWAYGIAAGGNINIKSGKVVAKGGLKGLFAETGIITLKSPLFIASPWDGSISTDGHTVVDENKEIAGRVVIMIPPISGSIALSTLPSPNNELSFTLSGEIAGAETENTWQISDDDATWQDIEEYSPAGAPANDGVNRVHKVANELVYIPTEDQIGMYIRVKVASKEYSGYLYSPSRQITKKLCTDVPAVPTLTNINDKVYLSNAKTTQEYIIFNTSKEASSLTENDWANAVTPDSEVGFFELNSTTNANHTVFTRIKETTSTLASESVAEARLYIGTSVYLQDIELNISKTVGYFQNINNELNCKVGDVIRCDASPVPSNATNWYGISGSNWTVDYRNTGSPYGAFYEDADCTIPISSSSNYTTVYLKTLATKNYLDIRIMAYNSAIGYKTRYVQFNVTPDGYFPLLDYITNCSMTIAAGEKITDIEVGRRPFSGSVYGLTTEVSGEGSAPNVQFTLYERLNVDATNATPGVYTFTPIQNGNPITTSTFTITVTDGKYAVDSILMREKNIIADPGQSIELVAQLMPSNSEADITWTSSNTSVVTVLNGIATIAENAPIGAMATITASANGKSDECEITVSGEEYDLYVASTRVTSRNQDDILGDGTFSFDGMSTLTIKGDYTINNSANLVRNTGIEGLYINIGQTCTISQGSDSYSTLFDLRKNTTIRGEQMTVNGNGVAFSTQGGMTLTLDSANLVVNAIMPFKGSGIADDNMNIINSNLEVNASGTAAIFSFTGGISLSNCYIKTPEGAIVANGAIEDGNGSQVRNLLIVPNPEKTEPELAFALSEAIATVGETFITPTLSNPNNLTITYYSENPMIAKVDDETGEVTPISAGTTTIIAYTDGNLYHMAGQVSYTLIVLKGSVSLSFTQNSVNVRIDDEEFVLPTLNNPQDVSVTYSSSNPAVATVLAISGDVTLVAVGTTTIIATFLGDKSYNQASASYDLIVTDSTSTDLNNISTLPNASSVQKILRNGQLIIMRDAVEYNVMGQEL